MGTVSFTNLLTDGSATDATSYATAAIACTSGRLYVATYVSGHATSVPTPTCSSDGGETCPLIAQDDSVVPSRGAWIFAFRATATANRVLTFSHGATTVLRGLWNVEEVPNARTGGANGVGNAFGQTIGGSGTAVTTATLTLGSALGHADNRIYGGGYFSVNPAVTTGTQIAESAAIETARISTAFHTANSLVWTFASGTWAGAAVEVVNNWVPKTVVL